MSTLPAYTSKNLANYSIKKVLSLTELLEATKFICFPDRAKRVIVPFHNKDLPKGTLISILK